MAPFVPSAHFIDFTNLIIKRCIDDDHFNFTIFPLFIQFFLPFSSSKDCKASIDDMQLEYKTHFKDYKMYFKSLLLYYKLLTERYNTQSSLFSNIENLASLAYNVIDATSSEMGSPTPSSSPTTTSREPLIGSIQQSFIQLNQLNSAILKEETNFKHIVDWDCSDLHFFIRGKPLVATSTTTHPATTTDPATTTSTTDPATTTSTTTDPATDTSRPITGNISEFAQKCVQNMKGDKFVVDFDSLIDDTPDILFKKYITIVCNLFDNDDSFNNAKFWVLSQLYTRL
jgi:hypothetical protein